MLLSDFLNELRLRHQLGHALLHIFESCVSELARSLRGGNSEVRCDAAIQGKTKLKRPVADGLGPAADQFELFINLETAKALGLTMPQMLPPAPTR